MRSLPLRGPAPADLHMHSTYSDGLHSPRELVRLAAAAGLKAISITDHDAVEGFEEAHEHGRELNVEVIPGVELSSTERGVDIHVLGYFVDPLHPELNEYLRVFREERIRRVHKIVQLLQSMGCPVSYDTVMRLSPRGSVGRPHVAQAMVQSGFVSSAGEAFALYLGDDRPAFVPKYRISAGEALRLINAAGGVSCLAHPGNTIPESVIIDLMKQGLQGVETVHPRHSAGDVYRFRALVARHGLLETGGSDFHGAAHEVSLGTYVVPYTAVRRMREVSANQVQVGNR